MEISREGSNSFPNSKNKSLQFIMKTTYQFGKDMFHQDQISTQMSPSVALKLK